MLTIIAVHRGRYGLVYTFQTFHVLPLFYSSLLFWYASKLEINHTMEALEALIARLAEHCPSVPFRTLFQCNRCKLNVSCVFDSILESKYCVIKYETASCAQKCNYEYHVFSVKFRL